MLSISLFLVAAFFAAAQGVALGSYNVDPDSVTVSGLSSGGAMAMQLHVAFSSIIRGSGVLAGIPFACAEGGLTSANLCMYSPTTIDVQKLISRINTLASSSDVDSTSNLSGDNVYIFHGTRDTTVNPVNGHKTEEVYAHFGANIKTEYSIAAVHGYPTDFYGAACGSSSATTQYINNCNYHGAFETLNHLYNGTLTKPTGSETLAQLKTYEQGEFGGNAVSSMDGQGFVYVPTRCADKTKKCLFHVSLHGCQQYRGTVGDIYATKTGYLQVAEVNDIIVIFPQAATSILAGNPNGCWDWWGYLNKNFVTKSGAQMKAINNMISRVAFCDGAPNCYEEPDVTTTTTLAPPTPTTGNPGPTTTGNPGPTTTGTPGECRDNEVSFHPFPLDCAMYTLCACGASVLLQCAPGLVFDPSINNCNFIQLVNCEGGVRP